MSIFTSPSDGCNPLDIPCVIKSCPITANTLINTYKNIADYANLDQSFLVKNMIKIFAYHYVPLLIVMIILALILYLNKAIGVGSMLFFIVINIAITSLVAGLAYWDISSTIQKFVDNKQGLEFVISAAYAKSDSENKYKCFS